MPPTASLFFLIKEPDWGDPFQHRGCVIPEDYYWEEQTFELPIIPEGMQWRIVEYTADDKDKFDGQPVDGKVKLIGRSVMIIIAQ